MNETKSAKGSKPVPSPPHPHRRREPLPGEQPKPGCDDPGAPARVQKILASATYRQADQDIEWLSGYETRGVRLQIDYEKTEHLMERKGIRHTVVVFGSTRIHEPAQAQRRVEELRAKLAAAPDDAELQRCLAVAERLLDKSRYYEVARKLGRLVGQAADGPDDFRLVMMTGGGPGMMEAANRGAWEAGGPSIGLNISLPHEQYPNPYITPDLCFRFHYFALRKMHFLLRTRALVVFPGGYGTLDELFETLTLIQTRKIRPIPVVLVGEAYWKRVFDVGFLVDEGVIDHEDRELFWYAETAEDIWDGIRAWHEANDERTDTGPVAGQETGPPAESEGETTASGEGRER
jgi:uncharacterized protein (TIGR00730 family)